MTKTTATRSTEFHQSAHGLRGFTIVRDDSKSRDMRFEVIYQTGKRENPISWAFFTSKADALAFAKEVR
jgi:hypothetical protein